MQYKIPLFKLNFDKTEEEAVVKTLQSQWISTGPKCEAFESKFAEMLNVKYAISVNNCTNALHLAYHLAGILPGDEVICPSYTFVATVNSIKYVGGKPVFCDIKGKEDLNLNVDQIESLITHRTKAIAVVHMAGFPVDMDKVLSVATKHNLRVIEDSSHAPMSEYKGKKLGTIGDIGCFSFFSNKNISTGEGGMVVTNSEDLASRAKLLRSHGMTSMSYQRSKGHATSYDVVELGYNFRMDDIRASLGITQLGKLQNDLEKRAKVRKWYVDQLSDIHGITIPFKDNAEFVTNYIMPVVLNESVNKPREEIRSYLHEHGIQTSVHYPAIHRFTVYNDSNSDLKHTEYVADHEITLPMYGDLSFNDVKYIVEVLKDAINN